MSRLMRAERGALPCAEQAALFQHPLVECDPEAESGVICGSGGDSGGGSGVASGFCGAGLTQREVARRQELLDQARSVCAGCRARRVCLYEAVAVHDVAGFVAGTTESERRDLRKQLGISIPDEDLDVYTYAGERARYVTSNDVARAHAVDRFAPLWVIANRLDCSVSTVKRRLRQERARVRSRAEKTQARDVREG